MNDMWGIVSNSVLKIIVNFFPQVIEFLCRACKNLEKARLDTHVSHELFVVWIMFLCWYHIYLGLVHHVRSGRCKFWVVDRPCGLTQPDFILFFFYKQISTNLKRSGNNYSNCSNVNCCFPFKIGIERFFRREGVEHKT